MAQGFKPRSESDIADLVAAYPLALVSSLRQPAAHQVPLPMLAERDGEGRITSLVGHMALRNPLVEPLQQDPRALFTFLGPHAYISPRLVSKPGWAPTWNYAVAWIEADVQFRPERNHDYLQRLVRHLEGEGEGAWNTDAMGERYAKLSAYIIAFDATVRSVNAKFKLGQDESRTTFEEIVAGIGAPELVEWMRRFEQ